MRYIDHWLRRDLCKKMVFVGGPRQCGKTTYARSLLKDIPSGVCLNWDFDEDRQSIVKRRWDESARLLVLDELPKFPRWKSWLKGIYDVLGEKHQILVTGSARLDVYRRGGDSLLGRYHYWRLHPFSLHEVPRGMTRQEALSRLMRVGGFPEPFFDGDEREARWWRQERIDRVLKDDVRDLENLRDIQTLGLFVQALRTRVGGLVVLSNIAQELQVAPKTLAHWLEVLERMYVVFTVRPYVRSLPRAIQKPPKVYFFDNADVIGDEGARFENLVATHLLKEIQFLQDRDGFSYELRYVRDKEGPEVDFVVTKDGAVDSLVEAKWSDGEVAPDLRYYAERLKPLQAKQILGRPSRPRVSHGVTLEDATEAFGPLSSSR